MTTTSPALVIGGGSANSLGITRNLGNLGIPVYCLTGNPHEITCFSKYCAGAMIVPDVERRPVILQRVLQAFQRRHCGQAVLFPTTDDAVLSLSTLRDTIPPFVTFIPPRHVVETLVMKTRFYPSLQQHGVPHPRTWTTNTESLHDALHTVEFPVYIRPSESLRFSTQFRRKGFQANTPHELRQYLKLVTAHNIEVLVQEIIPGPTSNLHGIRGYLDQHSQPLAVMADQKIHQPSMFANNSVKRSIPLTLAGISHATQTLLTYLQRIKYTGLFHSEWKHDPRDNMFKLLEINARSSGGNYFAAQCGLNHILLAYHDALGAHSKVQTTYDVDIYQINLVIDMHVFLSTLIRRSWSGWRLTPYLRNKKWHTFASNDPRPFLERLRALLPY